MFKPYHIDDAAHLEIARWIASHPLHPMQGTLNWSGVEEPVAQANQPHLYFYLLALWGSVFGYSEPAMHALQSLFSLGCIVLFYRLARHMIWPIASWATAMLVLGPAFVVEQNLMVDVPLLATWLFVFHALIVGADSPRQTRRYVIAAVAVSAALLIKYSSLIPLLILCVSLTLERRRAQAWTVLIPVATLAAWSLFNVWDYGSVHIATRPQGTHSPLRLVQEAGAWVLALGALSPLGVIAMARGRRGSVTVGKWGYLLGGAAFAALVVAIAIGLMSDLWSDRVLWVVFMTNGLLIGLALAAGCRDFIGQPFWQPEIVRHYAPAIYLLLWFGGTTAFYVLFSPFVAARHVLLVMPPILLLLGSRWQGSLTLPSRVFGLGLTVVVSAGLCLSDWRFAEFYKESAARIAHSLEKTGTIWASGHWGWQWYAEQDGMREVDVRASQVRPGDYLVVADTVDHQSLEKTPSLRLIRTETEDKSLLDLFCTGRKSRFYLSSERFGPWSLSLNCQNQISIYQVEAK